MMIQYLDQVSTQVLALSELRVSHGNSFLIMPCGAVLLMTCLFNAVLNHTFGRKDCKTPFSDLCCFDAVSPTMIPIMIHT
jgi:hypothetical protein